MRYSSLNLWYGLGLRVWNISFSSPRSGYKESKLVRLFRFTAPLRLDFFRLLRNIHRERKIVNRALRSMFFTSPFLPILMFPSFWQSSFILTSHWKSKVKLLLGRVCKREGYCDRCWLDSMCICAFVDHCCCFPIVGFSMLFLLMSNFLC